MTGADCRQSTSDGYTVWTKPQLAPEPAPAQATDFPPPGAATARCAGLKTANHYDYNQNFVRNELGDSKAVIFQVKAHNDAHVGFFKEEPATTDGGTSAWTGVGHEHYEIVCLPLTPSCRSNQRYCSMDTAPGAVSMEQRFRSSADLADVAASAGQWPVLVRRQRDG